MSITAVLGLFVTIVCIDMWVEKLLEYQYEVTEQVMWAFMVYDRRLVYSIGESMVVLCSCSRDCTHFP